MNFSRYGIPDCCACRVRSKNDARSMSPLPCGKDIRFHMTHDQCGAEANGPGNPSAIIAVLFRFPTSWLSDSPSGGSATLSVMKTKSRGKMTSQRATRITLTDKPGPGFCNREISYEKATIELTCRSKKSTCPLVKKRVLHYVQRPVSYYAWFMSKVTPSHSRASSMRLNTAVLRPAPSTSA